MSRLAVWLALGQIRRVAGSCDEAEDIYQRHPGDRGRLALAREGELIVGRPFLMRMALIVTFAWARSLVAVTVFFLVVSWALVAMLQ